MSYKKKRIFSFVFSFWKMGNDLDIDLDHEHFAYKPSQK